ncbi:MAG: HAD-IC family P-type ATPase, partial [Streptococcus sp.]|nr:HAD-IC family P-type ATPase [Streptococcus sp.]
TFAQKRWKIGKKGFVLDAEIKTISDREKALIDTWENEGKTLVYVSANQELMGIMALEDQLKPDSLVAVKALQNMGIKTIMLTGDQEKTACHIATELGLDDVVANCMPQDKSDRIKELQEKYGSVAMVGDGINDAPALVTADVSFAVGSGTDIAIESADVVLLEDLTRIPFAISLSQKMKHIVLENIIFALAIIISLIAANVVQVINLPLGVVGHEGSTILVILNGLRLLAFDQKFEKSYNKGKTCMKENPNDTCPKNCTYPDCLHPLG